MLIKWKLFLKDKLFFFSRSKRNKIVMIQNNNSDTNDKGKVFQLLTVKLNKNYFEHKFY